MIANNPFGTNYPFIQPSADIQGLVYDAYISYYDPSLNYNVPFRISEIGPNTLTIVDSKNNVIFSDSMRLKRWSDDYAIMQKSSAGVSVAIIVSTKLTSTIQPDDGTLCIRCVYTQPRHVTSLSVGSKVLKQNITMEYGYNTLLECEMPNAEDAVVRPVNLITVNVAVGTGAGTTPCIAYETDSSPNLYTINGESPDNNGNFCLTSDACISVHQRGDVVIGVSDGCTQCCKCEDFTAAAKRLDEIIGDYYYLGGEAEAVRDSLKQYAKLLDCSSLIMITKELFCPIRCYLDTTWPRKPIITAEFRNSLPAIVEGLTMEVTVDCSPLVRHEALRTMKTDNVACDGDNGQTQDNDNYGRIDGISHDWEPSNKWTVDWSDLSLQPGATLWATVSGINGNPFEYKDAEPIRAMVKATYKMRPLYKADNAAFLRRIAKKNIRNQDMASGIIKGGYGFADLTGTLSKDGALANQYTATLVQMVRDSCTTMEGEDDASGSI